MRDGNEQNYIKAMFFCFVISLFVFGYNCFSLGRASVSNHGAGTDTVRNQLDAAGTNQHEITSGIKNATDRVENVQGKLGQAEQRAECIEADEREAGAIITDCKQILRTVRSRGKVEAAKD